LGHEAGYFGGCEVLSSFLAVFRLGASKVLIRKLLSIENGRKGALEQMGSADALRRRHEVVQFINAIEGHFVAWRKVMMSYKRFQPLAFSE
jgi:hypothetical protein